RHRNAPLGIEAEHIMGHEPVHLALRRTANPKGPAASTGKSPPNLSRGRYRRLSRMTRWLGEYGLSWGCMGVNGSTLPRNTAFAGRLASGKLKEWLRSRLRIRVRIASSRGY